MGIDLSGFLKPILSRNSCPGCLLRFPLRHEHQRCLVFQTGVGSNGIVVLAPGFDDDLYVGPVEDPFINEFVRVWKSLNLSPAQFGFIAVPRACRHQFAQGIRDAAALTASLLARPLLAKATVCPSSVKIWDMAAEDRAGLYGVEKFRHRCERRSYHSRQAKLGCAKRFMSIFRWFNIHSSFSCSSGSSKASR